MKTNPRYWQELPSNQLYRIYSIYEMLRTEPDQKPLPRGVKSMQGLLSRKKERNGIELIVYNECLKRQLIEETP